MTGAERATGRGGPIFFTLAFLVIAVFFAWQFGQQAVIIAGAPSDPDVRKPVKDAIDHGKAAWEAAASVVNDAQAKFDDTVKEAKAACEDPRANCPDEPPGWKVWKGTERVKAAACVAARELACDNAKNAKQEAESILNRARLKADALRQ